MKKFLALTLFFFGFLIPITAQCPNYSRPGIHVVQSGENLYRIAIRYNLTTYNLAQWNNIATNSILNACQELNISNPNIFRNEGPTNYEEEFTSRGQNTNSSVYLNKQAGNKHTIRSGETIAELAKLYGYTEERFRNINLLKPEEELSVGSVILSSDCACERVVTYDEINHFNRSNYNNRGTNDNKYYSNNNYKNEVNDTYQNRGGNYDSFYDNPQGDYEGYNPPPSESLDNKIRSRTNQSTNYDRRNSNPSRTPSTAIAPYMSSEELAMLDEINLMRANPAGYIPYIEQYKRDIQSGKSFGSSLEVCNELIEELKRTPRLSILHPARCIYNAAKKHGLDQKSRGSTGHDGSDGSWPWDRVKRECSQMTDGNENLVGGPADVREAVILLLVDDGIPSRGHRKTLLNKDWTYGATYKIGKVGYMPNCWVQKFGY